jgi:cobaltochelatase CobN
VAVAVDSLKNPASLALLQSLAAQHQVGVVLNATSFAVTALDGGDDDRWTAHCSLWPATRRCCS